MPDTSPTPVDLDAIVEKYRGEWWAGKTRSRATNELLVDFEIVVTELRSARAAIGPDSERIREAEQVIADAFDGWQPAPPYGATAARIAGRLRAAGLLLGPDKVAVDREALRHVLRYGFGHGPCQICTSVSAALSEPQPKPEGTS